MNKWIVVLLFIVVLVLSACTNQSDNSTISQAIEESLDAIVNVQDYQVQMSSNPNDYIASNEEAYQQIIKQGDDSLAYLTEQLRKSEQSGLREWIMAKACVDILKNQNPVKEWSTGKEWIKKYDDLVNATSH